MHGTTAVLSWRVQNLLRSDGQLWNNSKGKLADDWHSPLVQRFNWWWEGERKDEVVFALPKLFLLADTWSRAAKFLNKCLNKAGTFVFSQRIGLALCIIFKYDRYLCNNAAGTWIRYERATRKYWIYFCILHLSFIAVQNGGLITGRILIN